MQISSYINGALYAGDSQYSKTNPFTGEALHTVKSADTMGLVMAIQAANGAYLGYKASTNQQRTQIVDAIKQTLVRKKNEYARLEALDQGLPLALTLKYNLENSIQNIDRLLGTSISDESSHTQAFPIGVIAITVSWNMSLRLVLERLVPALLAGNAVVIKVSVASPVTAFILADLIEAAALPPGLVNVLVTESAEVKKFLLAHPGIKAVSMTGKLETAANVIQALSLNSMQNFKKLQISAGTKNSAVDLSEPTVQRVQTVMESFMFGQGQLAWNSSRLFVLEKHEERWTELLQNYLSQLRPSEGIEDSSLWTPCLKKESHAKYGEIQAMAKEDQAKLLKASEVETSKLGRYLTPLFTKDMSRCSTLQQDQVHAPFFILSAVKYPFDVAKYSNVSYFGFAAHLWGEPEKLKKVAEALDVAAIFYNSSSYEQVGPIAGIKQSGYGLQDFRAEGVFYSNLKTLQSSETKVEKSDS